MKYLDKIDNTTHELLKDIDTLSKELEAIQSLTIGGTFANASERTKTTAYISASEMLTALRQLEAMTFYTRKTIASNYFNIEVMEAENNANGNK